MMGKTYGGSQYSGLVGPLHPIGKIERIETNGECIPGFQFWAVPADFSNIHPKWASWREVGRSGCAYSVSSREDAIDRSVGEALEFYAGCCAALTKRRWSTARELQRENTNSIPPSSFPQFYPFSASSQRKYDFFHDELPINWVIGCEIGTGEPILVPAQYGLFPYLKDQNEPTIMQTNSNGISTHRSLSRAILNSVCEIFERESLLIHWWHNIKPRYVSKESYPDVIKQVESSYNKLGLDLKLYMLDAELGWKTIIAAIFQPETKYLPWMCGHSCSPCPVDASISAVEELTKAFNMIDHDSERSLVGKYSKDTSVLNVEDHYRFYCHPKNWKSLEQYLSCTSTVDLLHQNAPFDYCSTSHDVVYEYYTPIIAKKFPKSAFVDYTPNDLRALGYFVTKVILPASTPIIFGQPLGYCESERIASLVKRWKHDDEPSEINTLPHIVA